MIPRKSKASKKCRNGSRNRDFEANRAVFSGPPTSFVLFHLPHRTCPTTRQKSSTPMPFKQGNLEMVEGSCKRCETRCEDSDKSDKDSETQGIFSFLPSPLPLPEGAPNPSPSWTVAMQPSQFIWRVGESFGFHIPKNSHQNRVKK